MTEDPIKGLTVLALDIGTSGIRAAVYDHAGDPLAGLSAISSFEISENVEGSSEADAERLLSQAFLAIDEVVRKLPAESRPPEYGAVSCFWHSLLGIDASGNATTRIYTWAETRPASQIKLLKERIDESSLYNRTGCPIHSSYWPAKLTWLRNHDPEAFGNTAKWISLSDFLYLRLFGKLKTSVSIASGTGLFNIRKCEWDAEILGGIGLSENSLPMLADDRESAVLGKEYSGRWPILKETRWFPAIGDGAANNIGSGCVTKDRAALMIGTSGAMRVAFEGDVPEQIPFGLFCYRIDRRKVVIGGALSDGGGLYEWLKKNLRLAEDDGEIEKLLTGKSPNGHGLIFLPFVHGERSTGYHETAHGAVIGLNAGNDGIDILRAAMESVAYRFAEILKLLSEIVDVGDIAASGGALKRSGVWAQIVSDVLGRDLMLSGVEEASLRGAVLAALEAAGDINDLSEVITAPGTPVNFDEADHYVFVEAKRRHDEYYKRLITQSDSVV